MVAVGALGAWSAHRYRLPGGVLVWALVPVAVVSLVAPDAQPFDRHAMQVAQIAIGTVVGAGVRRRSLVAVRRAIVPVAATIALVLLAAAATGVALWRAAGMAPLTALLASIPGSASDIVAVALELGADAGIVAGFQLVRQVAVLTVVGTALGRLAGGPDATS